MQSCSTKYMHKLESNNCESMAHKEEEKNPNVIICLSTYILWNQESSYWKSKVDAEIFFVKCIYAHPHTHTHFQARKHTAPSWNANLWLASLCGGVISQKPSHCGAQKTHSLPELLRARKNYGTQMNSFMWERIYSIIIDFHSFNAT